MERKNATAHEPPFTHSYSRDLLIFDRGEGVYLYDVDGKRYLDFGAGIAVNALGYGRGFGCAAWNIGMGLLPPARGRGVMWLRGGDARVPAFALGPHGAYGACLGSGRRIAEGR